MARAYPWLTEANGPNSPIDDVQGLSDEAKRVYAYLATVTLRYGSSHSRVRTVAKVAGLSEYKARKAIHELERRGVYHPDAGRLGTVAGRTGIASSGSPTDSPVTASGFR